MSRENIAERAFSFPRQSIAEKIQSKFSINTENICHFIHPLVDFIHHNKPHYIFVLDTGARLTGVAVLALHKEMYGILPTIDRCIHFKRIGHSSTYRQVLERLKTDAEKMMKSHDSPEVFLIDDWVNTGSTSRKAKNAFSELSNGKIQVKLGVMREFMLGGADIRGDIFSAARTVWHHNPNSIGIKYSSEGFPQPMRTEESLLLRRKIFDQAKRFASNLKEDDTSKK
jgi:hypothetical protein